jgi:hypothetical protein
VRRRQLETRLASATTTRSAAAATPTASTSGIVMIFRIFCGENLEKIGEKIGEKN